MQAVISRLGKMYLVQVASGSVSHRKARNSWQTHGSWMSMELHSGASLGGRLEAFVEPVGPLRLAEQFVLFSAGWKKRRKFARRLGE